MQKAKLNILFAQFCYAGNGGVATVLPDYVPWFAKVYSQLQRDERVGKVSWKQYGDIPLDYERNKVVKDAKQAGIDVIVMLDSDNVPDLYLGRRPEAKSFIETSFDFLYEREMRGLPTVVFAPYCGPPPHPTKGGGENVYVFHAIADESFDEEPDRVVTMRLEGYSREHAAIMRGIQSAAAGPTGCIMYSMSAFDLLPVRSESEGEVIDDLLAGQIDKATALRRLRMESWFFYEPTDLRRTAKASTEDVTNTREIGFAGLQKHKEPVVFCNWDAWAGHFKPKCVGAPLQLKLESVSNLFKEVVLTGISEQEQIVEIDYTGDDLPLPNPAVAPRTGGSDDYMIGEDGAKLTDAPPVKKQLRLGVPFEKPLFANETLLALREIVEMQSKRNTIRIAVFGDTTGELSLAADYSDKNIVYSVGKNATVRSERVRSVPKFEYSESQDLDMVVVRGDNDSGVYVTHLVELMMQHIRLGGSLAIVSRQQSDETPIYVLNQLDEQDDNYDYMPIDVDGLGLHIITKRQKDVTPEV